jgi:uncharacterized protein
MDTLVPTPLTTLRRVPSRGSYDRAAVHAILDEGLVAMVGFVADGHPFVIPMAYGRLGDQLILHGARASRVLRGGAAAERVCVTVTLVDGIVLARSAFHHSMNYRSVVVLGQPRELTLREEKLAALAAVVDHVLPGRAAQARPPDDKELGATRVLTLAIEEASAKIRTGGPLDDEADLAHPCWAGHVPLALTAGTPIPANDRPVPASLLPYRRGAVSGR